MSAKIQDRAARPIVIKKNASGDVPFDDLDKVIVTITGMDNKQSKKDDSKGYLETAFKVRLPGEDEDMDRDLFFSLPDNMISSSGISTTVVDNISVEVDTSTETGKYVKQKLNGLRTQIIKQLCVTLWWNKIVTVAGFENHKDAKSRASDINGKLTRLVKPPKKINPSKPTMEYFAMDCKFTTFSRIKFQSGKALRELVAVPREKVTGSRITMCARIRCKTINIMGIAFGIKMQLQSAIVTNREELVNEFEMGDTVDRILEGPIMDVGKQLEDSELKESEKIKRENEAIEEGIEALATEEDSPDVEVDNADADVM